MKVIIETNRKVKRWKLTSMVKYEECNKIQLSGVVQSQDLTMLEPNGDYIGCFPHTVYALCHSENNHTLFIDGIKVTCEGRCLYGASTSLMSEFP